MFLCYCGSFNLCIFIILAFRCAYCFYWNPARKQRPAPPRLETLSPHPAAPVLSSTSPDDEDDDEDEEESSSSSEEDEKEDGKDFLYYIFL